MSESLGPQFAGQTLYHGTIHDIEGGAVKPAEAVGKASHWGGLSDTHKAYATENEETAWMLAKTGADHTMYSRVKEGGVPDRARVYRVTPTEHKPQMGEYHDKHPHYAGDNLQEWTAPEFKVKEQIDVQPDRQGTLPMNWNQFTLPGRFPKQDEFNHPNDMEIEHGHHGSTQREEYNASMGVYKYGKKPGNTPPPGWDPYPNHQGRLF
jgi:hypothetical protein